MTGIIHRLLLRFGVAALTFGMSSLAVLLSFVITSAVMMLQHSDDWVMVISLSIILPGVIAPLLSYQSFALIRELEDTKQRLHVQATLDDLTQTYNRRHFLEMANLECEKARRYGFALTVILLDIDRFKQINDTYSHIAGDEVLRALGRVIPGLLRQSDILGRFGGDEFILFLPHTDLARAGTTAERLRYALSQMTILHNEHEIHFTISLGIASANTPYCDLDQLLYHADLALYRAKNQGRNRIESTQVALPEIAMESFQAGLSHSVSRGEPADHPR